MDDLESLELFSLVSRITGELQNHLGVSDKTLAEFVIDQHLSCGSFDEFKGKLEAMGAEFPQSLMESIDRLVLTMHPKYKSKKANVTQEKTEAEGDMDVLDALEKKARVFKGLAVPDKQPQWDEDDNIRSQDVDERDAKAGAMDDTFEMLEGLAGKAREDKGRSTREERTSRKRSRSPDYDDFGRGRRREANYRSRSRSRSPDYSKRHDEVDEFGRSTSKYGVRDDKYRNGRSERRRRRDRDEDDDYFRKPPPVELDEQPILYKIYDGRVTGVKDFGAFVNLLGVKGKVDGLVHVSAMQEA